jgi:uncharacterized protein (TIGR00255 family)
VSGAARTPVSGMTGFGRSEGHAEAATWIWEVRSVNGRGLDIKLRLPTGMDGLEPKVREACAARFRRGSLQLTLTVRRDVSEVPQVVVNTALLDQLLDASRPYVASGQVRAPDWAGLMQVRGVLDVADMTESDAVRSAREAAVLVGLEAALDGLQAGRLSEGRGLEALFAGLFDTIEALRERAIALADEQASAIQERVRRRAAELLADAPYDEARLVQEAASLALKADVQEEIDRLGAHLVEARAVLAGGGEIGRRLEFLAQEFHREANTLTSKAASIALNRVGLDLKAAIDRLKEQSANAE